MVDPLLLGQVEDRAKALLERIASGDDLADLAAEIRRRDGDYQRVFTAEAAAAARRGYDAMPAASPAPRPGQTEVRVAVCPAGLLAAQSEARKPFPGGYRRIADKLIADRIWVAWRFVEPGKSTGLAYDGLVWIDDHFAWFPKPWRILAPRHYPDV